MRGVRRGNQEEGSVGRDWVIRSSFCHVILLSWRSRFALFGLSLSIHAKMLSIRQLFMEAPTK